MVWDYQETRMKTIYICYAIQVNSKMLAAQKNNSYEQTTVHMGAEGQSDATK